MACVDDDAQGQPLDVLWEIERDARVESAADWSHLTERGFDPAEIFAAYLNTVRWNCVTATDPNLLLAEQQFAGDEAGFEMRFHELRHACATLLLAQGVHPRLVMDILGHSQISLTMNLYSHVIPAMQAEVAARIDQILDPAAVSMAVKGDSAAPARKGSSKLN